LTRRHRAAGDDAEVGDQFDIGRATRRWGEGEAEKGEKGESVDLQIVGLDDVWRERT
jgi:hypothetical protein